MIKKVILFISVFLSVFAQDDIAIKKDKIDKQKIVGGAPVDISKRSFQVAVFVDGGVCGGSIISKEKVLTAAHCVEGLEANQVLVYAGSSRSDRNGRGFNVKQIVVHPDYKPTDSMDSDVAVLTMAVPFEFSNKINPIALYLTKPAADTDAIVSGWGSMRSGGKAQKILRQVQVPIVDQETCKQQYGTTKITPNMICAGFKNGGKDSCQGDSGGPLTINDFLVGVVSFGNGCALPKFPGVYASVPDLAKWILAQ